MAAGEKKPISGRVVTRPTLLAAAVAAALSGGVPLVADAAGLGRLTVQSALGQPLQAEVEVTALGREELGSLSARLASPDAFRQAGLEYNPALSGLRFAIEQRPGGAAVVRVTSSQPVNEPFVDLLVELNWDSGRFVREYTFLLDPPELRMGRDTLVAGGAGTAVSMPALAAAPAAAVAPSAPPRVGAGSAISVAPVATSAARPAAPAAALPSPVIAAASPVVPPAVPADGAPGTVRVRSGDTAAKIAARIKPAHVTVEQAVMALYQANPRAFFGTVHQLFAGVDLTIPDAATMDAIDAADARREIRAQAAEFHAYRARLAASVRTVEPIVAGQTAEGSVAAKAEESAAPAESGDQLRLSRSGAAPETGSAGSATGSAEGVAASGDEMRVAQDAALREQQERVAALERNVADLQRLVELKNQQLADLQQQVETARAAGATASGTVGAAGVAAGVPEPASAAASEPAGASSSTPSSAAATSASTTAASVAGASTRPAASPTGSVIASDLDSGASSDTADAAASEAAAAAPSASTADSSGTTAQNEPGASSAAAAASAGSEGSPPRSTPASAAAPAQPSTPEPGVLETLMGNPLVLPAFAAIALGLGVYGVYALRRRRKADEFEDSLSSADAFTANSLFGSTGGQSVDTHASLFGPSARDSGVDVHSTEVDPIAEAEVYIAYGREAQAEEILKEALKRQPERQAIRLKLLEIHAARKDPIAFGALAQEMYDQAGGVNEEWAKVVTLGLAIDPANPLYTGQGESVATQPAVDDDPARADAFIPEESAFASVRDDAPAPAESAGVLADEPPAIADLGEEADAAAAMFGEPARDRAPELRVFGGSFAETLPMDDADASAEMPKDDEIPALDFDLDLDTTVGRAGSELASRTADEGAREAPDSALERAIGDRFELPSLELDGITAPEGSGGAYASEAASSGDEEVPALADLGDFSIDLPSLEDLDARDGARAEGDTPADDDLRADDERPAIDLAELEGGAGLGNLDLSSVDLDLSDGDVGLAAADTAVVPQVEASRWQEMATKLDLASAYEEIGDKEGARELLQEVLDGGDTAQQQKARTMLAKIG